MSCQTGPSSQCVRGPLHSLRGLVPDHDNVLFSLLIVSSLRTAIGYTKYHAVSFALVDPSYPDVS